MILIWLWLWVWVCWSLFERKKDGNRDCLVGLGVVERRLRLIIWVVEVVVVVLVEVEKVEPGSERDDH